MNRLFAMLGLLVLSLLVPARAELPQYVIRDLGTFGGSWGAEAMGVNSIGQVVGYLQMSQYEYRAFFWDESFIDLGPGRAMALNDSGVAVGGVPGYTPGYTADGFVWDGQRHDVPQGRLADINASGAVTGQKQSDYHAFVLMEDLYTDIHIRGAETSFAVAINDAGHVAFNCNFGYIYNTYQHAFVWDGVQSRDLGTFGGKDAWVMDINNHGIAVGWAQDTEGASAGFYWDGALRNLGVGYYPSSINDFNWIVGTGPGGTFVHAHGETQYLPTLGGANYYAHSISNSGVIAGSAGTPTGELHAVLWVPVPEPGSMVVLGGGLSLLCAKARSRHGASGN